MKTIIFAPYFGSDIYFWQTKIHTQVYDRQCQGFDITKLPTGELTSEVLEQLVDQSEDNLISCNQPMPMWVKNGYTSLMTCIACIMYMATPSRVKGSRSHKNIGTQHQNTL